MAPPRGLDGLRLPKAAFSPVLTAEAIGIPLHVDRDGVVIWVGYLHAQLVSPGIDVPTVRLRGAGHRQWFDPRFAAADPLTSPLLDGRAVWGPIETLRGLMVSDDTDGIYHPARYRLSDGSVLASYRLGHCGYLQVGDRLGDTSLPTARVSGITYRLVLEQEHIDRAPTWPPPTPHDRREVRAGPWASRAVTVVLPTYNEAGNLPTIVEVLLALPLANLRVLVVDDNSPDGTGDLADKLAAEHNTPDRERVALLRRPGKQGLGRAYVAGMTQALADGAEFVVQMDADLSHNPAHIPEMLGTLLSTRAGVVIGSRYTVSGSLDASWGLHRKLLSAWANLYVHLLLGLHVRDVTAGYKLWHRDTLA